MRFFFFFFNDTATTEIYTLSLHDALPIYISDFFYWNPSGVGGGIEDIHLGDDLRLSYAVFAVDGERSEEHTSELQSQSNLVCRLLLEKKNKEHRQRPSLITLEIDRCDDAA